ncbi:PQQ-binding-like beta-propeller repeat protein, partial [Corynebacterium bovis]
CGGTAMSGGRRIRPERRTRADLAATGVIAACVVASVAGVWGLSDARATHHEVAAEPVAAAPDPDSVPTSLTTVWRQRTTAPDLTTLEGTVVVTDGSTVSGVAAATGRTAWSYSRDVELCGVSGAWRRVVAVYRGEHGCGDVTSLDARSGEYRHTRAAIADDAVAMVRSLDSVGTVSPNRVELWRSDLVRTVEVGRRETPVNSEPQPGEDCVTDSALTRKGLLAVARDCPDTSGDGGSGTGDDAASPRTARHVALMKTAPSSASEPQVDHDFTVPAGAQLVGIAEDRAVIFVPGTGVPAKDAEDTTGSRFQVLAKDGSYTQYPAQPSTSVPADGPPATGPGGVFTPRTADMPHHMTWFDGTRVVAFDPATLRPDFTVDTIGTGAAMAGKLLLPVVNGIAVVDEGDGHTERIIPVDREGYEGTVTLQVQGSTVVEKRGDTVVGLTG